MKVAVIGATGLVGQEMLDVLQIRRAALGLDALLPVASSASAGKQISFGEERVTVVTLEEALEARPDVALFSAGGAISQEWAPRFTGQGAWVIDNSSAWRMDPGVPLVVPEVNMGALDRYESRLIANPNCSTIQLVVAMHPLHQAYGLERMVVSTYQSVTGTGKAAVEQMMQERRGADRVDTVYPHPIDLNCLPHCDSFVDEAPGYTKEEMKLVHESRKIMDHPKLGVSATAVRVPVMGGHSESVNASFSRPFSLEGVRNTLAVAPGVVLEDAPEENRYPMPLTAHRRDEVFVGRLRKDSSFPNTLNLWIVTDNLRKGAATNAVQIFEQLVARGAVVAS